MSVGPTVVIVSSPAGTSVRGSPNTFDYPILSSVNLMCTTVPTLDISVSYSWNASGCYSHNNYTGDTCFPYNRTTYNVTGIEITAKDAGTITCTITIDGMGYTSGPFTLRISGKILVVWKCNLIPML